MNPFIVRAKCNRNELYSKGDKFIVLDQDEQDNILMARLKDKIMLWLKNTDLKKDFKFFREYSDK
jgi:hypothetical protein